MPCEITVYLTGESTLCPHAALTQCADCRAELCQAHAIECEVCRMYVCGDCIIEHRFSHDQAEQKLRARA